LAITLNISGVLSRIDNVIYDATQNHTPRVIPQDVVVVAIDEQSLTNLGRWPWSRRLHGQLIDQLHADGAKVIGYDVMFVEPQIDDPLADRYLADAIGRAGNVVLPIVIEPIRRNGQLIEALPLPVIASKAAAMGRVHAELDADAIARSISLWEGLGQPVWPHFVQSVLAVAGQLPEKFSTQMPNNRMGQNHHLVKYDQRYINFSTAAHHLPSLSFEQVLRGHFQPGNFKDKLVLVGSTATGMADSLPTPVSGFQQPMPGVEFLANALISMRQESLVSMTSVWVSTAVACLLAILPMAWLPRTGNRVGAILTGLSAVMVLGVTMALPVVLQVWLPEIGRAHV
jgi:CHASE2 domain-containing sensor protein